MSLDGLLHHGYATQDGQKDTFKSKARAESRIQLLQYAAC